MTRRPLQRVAVAVALLLFVVGTVGLVTRALAHPRYVDGLAAAPHHQAPADRPGLDESGEHPSNRKRVDIWFVYDDSSIVASTNAFGAPGFFAPQTAEVIVDTNAVFNRPGVMGALRAGETPVMTQTVSSELSHVVGRGSLKMPRFASELSIVDDVMDVHTRINIRGQLEALRRGQPGLFGDGSIGATALRTGRPVITADQNFATVLRSMGVDVRLL